MIRIAVLGDRNLEYVTHRELNAALGLFVATLFQPQVGALAGRPLHPLIGAFLEAAARAAQPSTTPSI